MDGIVSDHCYDSFYEQVVKSGTLPPCAVLHSTNSNLCAHPKYFELGVDLMLDLFRCLTLCNILFLNSRRRVCCSLTLSRACSTHSRLTTHFRSVSVLNVSTAAGPIVRRLLSNRNVSSFNMREPRFLPTGRMACVPSALCERSRKISDERELILSGTLTMAL